MSIFFSIVIPLYNKEKHIKKTLDSVLCQTYGNYEVVIVNDGSTDESLHLVEGYTDSRVRIISQKNAGVSAARNTGIMKSKYEYIALIDADDWWDPNYLENMKSLVLAYPKADLYASEYTRVFKGRQIPSMNVLSQGVNHGLINPLSYGIQNGALPLHTSSVVIKKGILEQTGLFDNRISYFEDYDLFLRIISCGELAYGKNGGAYYNIDVNPDEKLTGNLPALNRHFVSYTDKLKPYFDNNQLLKLFIDRFIITSLIPYHRSGASRAEILELTRDVNDDSYYLKDRLLLSLPSKVANIMVESKIWLNQLVKKDLY